jgi:hypothetical protein
VPDSSDFQQLLTAAGVSENEAGPDDLRTIWRLTGQSDEALFDEFLNAVEAACAPTWEGRPLEPGELGLRYGQWRIDLGLSGVRAALGAALAASALAPHGFADFTVTFIAAVLPAVIEVERVELSPGDERLLLELRLKREIRSNFMTEDQLYDALPAETRAIINRYDFADFVGRLREAGFAAEHDGLITVWPA